MKAFKGWLGLGVLAIGLTGCGGGSGIEEGTPEDLEVKQKAAEDEFRSMMQGMDKDQMKAQAKPEKGK